ncbi:MAG: Peptidase BlaR1 [Pedosphaera sp.]|nr:Peptidase BlaR1 [Pedosphaera sp.]
MNDWLSQTLVECLGWTLVHFLWQGLIIAALLAGYLRLSRNFSPKLRYLAGCLALLLLAAAPVITFHHVAGESTAPLAIKTDTIPAPAPVNITSHELNPPAKFIVTHRDMRRGLSFSEKVEMLFPWLVLGWSLGVFALSCRLLGGWLQIQRLTRSGVGPLEKIWRDKLAELAHRLGITRPVRLLQSALVEVPTVIGWLRPVILLPASCVVGLTPAQLETILAHELAHIRRHDYLVNLLQSVVETVLFYHPAVWWVSRQVRAERENCCDDLAVEVCGDRVAYARALATLEELRLAPAQLALAAAGPPLLPRIRRLAGQSAGGANRPAWPLAGIITLLIIAALAFGLRGNRALAGDGANEPANPSTNKPQAVKTEPSQRPQKILTTKGRQNILSKLDRIQVDSIKFDHVPITEVINKLSEIAKSRDPDEQGINFFIDRNSAGVAGTGLPMVALGTNGEDITTVIVTMDRELNNLRLADLLDVITRSTDRPIKYSVRDYAIVFSLKDPNEVPMEVRIFHVDPNTFRQGLEGVVGVPFGNISSGGASGGQTPTTLVPQVNVTTGISGVTAGTSGGRAGSAFIAGGNSTTSNLQAMVRQFFKAVGVDLNTDNPANVGKMFIWKDRKGILMVRSTKEDLDLIEAAIQKFNSSQEQNKETNGVPAKPVEILKPVQPKTNAAPQVNIKVKFVEIEQALLDSDSKPWYVKTFPGFPDASNQPPALPLASHNLTRVTNALSQVTNSVVAQLCGILTKEQFQQMIKALEQRDGVDELNAPEVTTESGRQAEMQAATMLSIVTGLKSSQDSQGKVNDFYQTESLPFGPTIDVMPRVSADEKSLEMKVIANVTEFLGYDDPKHAPKGSPEKPAFSHAVMPLPQFRLRQVAADATVSDGGTLVLSGVEAERVVVTTNKMPLLGNLPLMGQFFHTVSSHKTRKNLLIFVTPTLINPDGTRFNDETAESKAIRSESAK